MGSYNRKLATFITISNGQMKIKKGEGEYEYYDGWKGRIVEINRHEGEYDNKPIMSIHIKLWDMEEKKFVILTFTEGTYYYAGFFSRIENVDFNQTVLIGVTKPNKEIEGGRKLSESKLQFCYLKQPDEDGEVISKVEDFESRFKPNIIRKKSGKTETDWDEVIEEVNNLLPELNTKIKKSLEKIPIKDMTSIPETNKDDEKEEKISTKKETSKKSSDNISDDDLPF